MPLFLTEHLDGCTPLSPCASCKALTFLRLNLKGKLYGEFLKIVSEAYGLQKPIETRPAVDLEESWQDVFPDLSTRLRCALINDNLTTVGDIVAKTEAEIRRTPNVGDVSVTELTQALASKGLALAEV